MADFKISEEISLGGPYLRQMAELAAAFERVETKSKALKKTLNGLTVGKGVVESLATLERKVLGLETVAGRAVEGVNKKLAAITLGGKPHESITAFRDHLGTLTATAGKVGTAIQSDLVRGLSIVRTETQNVKSSIAGWSSEIAAAEAKLSGLSAKMRAVTGGSGGGRSIRYGGGGGHGGGSALDVLAMGPQHSGVFAGLNVEHGLGSLVMSNGELQRQLNLYRMAGASPESVAAARSAAYRSATLVPDVGVSEQMKLFRELVGATGDEKGSMLALPDAAKTLSIMGATTGRHSEEDMKRLFKFIELRGVAIDEHSHKIDIDKFGAELNYATKAMTAAQGLITSNDMLQFAKQAGSMAKGMSGDELFTTMLASMEDMGGARSGTSLTAVGRQFLGGIMTGGKVKRLDELGMLNRAGVDRSDPDKPKITDPTKAIVGYDTLTKKGFGAFMEDIFRPHLAEHGIGDRQKQNEELYRSVGTDTARRLMGLYLSGHEQVGIVAERFHKAMGASKGYDEIFGAGQDLQTSTKALGESIHTLKTALGDAAGVAPMLMSLARGISGLADAAKDHPALGSVATLGGVGASASLLGYGALQTVKGFGLPAAAAELTTAAKMLQGVAAEKGALQNQPGGGGKPGLFGTIAGALGLYTLAETAQSQNVLATPKAGDGFWKNVLNFLDPGLAAHVIGESIKKPAEEAGKAAGSATTKGFGSENYHGAGSAAGTSLLQGFLSIFSRMGETGIQPTSFGGGDLGGLIHRASFGGDGAIGTFNGKALPVDGGLGIGHSASKADRAAYIRQAALRNGIDPEVALRVAQSEGFNKYVGDYGTSFGDWQLHFGGSGIRGMNSGGLGDVLRRKGINAKDPSTWRQQTDFAMKWAREHGWGDWHGARRAGIGNRQGIGTVRPQEPARPPVQPYQRSRELQANLHVDLDGRRIAMNTSRHQFDGANGPATGASFADASELYPQV